MKCGRCWRGAGTLLALCCMLTMLGLPNAVFFTIRDAVNVALRSRALVLNRSSKRFASDSQATPTYAGPRALEVVDRAPSSSSPHHGNTSTLSQLAGREDKSGLPPAPSNFTGRALHATPSHVIKALKPLWYLHVPKCGSSFATCIAHAVCGKQIPRNLTIRDQHRSSLNFMKKTSTCKYKWTSVECTTPRWNAQCGKGSFSRFNAGHGPLPRDLPSNMLKHVVAMFRNPEDRIISGWEYDKHDCEEAKSLQVYADCVGSCSANMLVGIKCGKKKGGEADLRLALKRVRNFGFVGLTGDWDLSICLFHAMYGGECLPVEFVNVRPGQYSKDDFNASANSLFGAEQVKTWWDTAVYESVKDVFWTNIHKYDVRRSTCMMIYCPQAAERFEIKTGDGRRVGALSEFEFDWPGRYRYRED